MTLVKSIGIIAPPPLVASVILSILAVTGMYLLPSKEAQTSVMLTPTTFYKLLLCLLLLVANCSGRT